MEALSDTQTIPGDMAATGPSLQAESSVAKVQWVDRYFSRWLAAPKGKDPEILSPDLTSLFTNFAPCINDYLGKLFSEVRKVSEEEYPPRTLRFMLAVMQMKVKDLELSFNLETDVEYLPLQMFLNAVIKRKCDQGGQPAKLQASVISGEMEDELWAKGILGDSSGETLLLTVFYLIGKHFALRGGMEHRNLRAGLGSQVKVLGMGREERVVFEESCSKTFGNLRNINYDNKTGVIYPTGGPRCPVAIIKKYLSAIPPNATAFYCSPLLKPKATQWFSCVPVGKNSLSSFMKKIAEKANWDRSKNGPTTH